MKNTLRFTTFVLLLALISTGFAWAQGQVSGRITDADTGESLPGASIILVGTSMGAATDTDGEFTIQNVPTGSYTITASFVGYVSSTARISVGAANVIINFELAFENISLQNLEIFASRAVDRKTPVAYTNLEKVQIQRELGSRDAPLVLNTSPSVYATAGGGGSGDARVNVRGFNQRNVGVMINGVPVNDMENGWVYWSNWDGIGDATTSLQLQRGLSAVNLAVPSIGGTMNIITDPAAIGRSVSVKQEFGNDGFLKTTAFASTGLIDGKYALTAGGVRKTGDGLYNGTWTDAWAYYFAGALNLNAKHRIDFYAVGAPQKHGQNLYMQNVAVYDEKFARDVLDDDILAFDEDGNGTADIFDSFGGGGREYNQNVSPVSPSYGGKQAEGSDTFSRYDKNFLNERENFFHKPQLNLNWYAQLSDDVLLSTVAYYSGGTGGGSGTAGDILWDYSGPSRRVNYDGTIAINQGDTTRKGEDKPLGVSNAILRNSRNNQWTIGAISKVKYTMNETTTLEAGLDWRTAEIEHYREVRDLLGGSHYIDNGDEFNPNKEVGLGDKIIYNFTNTVDWFGAFAQGEYVKDQLSVYGMGGLSMIKYTSTNHFIDDGTGNELYLEGDNIAGYQVKGGALYNVNDQVGIFANAGYVSKVPILDGVINDEFGALNDDPQNEIFTSLEAGFNFRSRDRSFAAKVNAYTTKWEDRTLTRSEAEAVGDDGLIIINGLNALHQGVEAEIAYQPHPIVRLDLAGSVGDWIYTDDVKDALYIADFNDPSLNEDVDMYIKDIKVGDQPQTQAAFAVTLFPVDGLYAKIIGKHFAQFYAAFSPLGRDDPADREQSWKTPSYTVFDLHLGYDVPANTGRFDVQLFANVFNVFDELYIQDASDNSSFNAFSDDPAGKNHRADDAEVFLGLGRTFNVGTTITFR